jgi:GNAT superfamily N-acetyltransferase
MAEWLAQTESLHRQLRPALPIEYQAYMRLMFSEGAHMVVLHEAAVPKAIAVYRIHQTTYCGRRFYIDDLVTIETERSRGFGAALLHWCEEEARAKGCDTFTLDSGVQRMAAHRFYFRHDMAITAFNFSKSLS